MRIEIESEIGVNINRTCPDGIGNSIEMMLLKLEQRNDQILTLSLGPSRVSISFVRGPDRRGLLLPFMNKSYSRITFMLDRQKPLLLCLNRERERERRIYSGGKTREKPVT